MRFRFCWSIALASLATLVGATTPVHAGPIPVANVDLKNAPAQLNNVGGLDFAAGHGGLFRSEVKAYTSTVANPANQLVNAWSLDKALYNGTTQKTITTFCIELNEHVGSGVHNLYVDAGVGSFVGLPDDNQGGPIIDTVTKEKLIRNLFAQHLTSGVDSDLASAAGDDTSSNAVAGRAFQLALWEIIFENSGTLDVTAGSFLAQHGGVGSSDSAAKTLANTYLSGLSVNGPLASGLFILDRDGAQGQIGIIAPLGVVTAAVPEPSTMMLGFVAIGGLAGYAVRGRRRAV